MVIGYTTGVFDLLHNGHLRYLASCKNRCDFLFIGVDVDCLVKKNKGKDRPFQSHVIRCQNIRNTGLADVVFIKTKPSIELIPAINPSIYFVPSNKIIRTETKEYINHNNIKLEVIPYTNGISTSLLINNKGLYGIKKNII